MPDPGEPHQPDRANFTNDSDYRAALEQYIRVTYPPEQTAAILESRTGIPAIERFLENAGEQ